MDLPVILRGLRKRWLAIVALAALGGAIALALTSQIPPTYSSKVTFFVSTPASSAAQLFNASQFSTDRVNSYVQLVSSDELARRIIASQHRSDDPYALSKRLSATADLNTVLLTARADGPTPDDAKRLAGGVKEEFGPLVQSLEAKSANSKEPTVDLSVVSGPTPPVKTSPKTKLNILVGLFLGTICALAWGVLRELSDSSVKSADELIEWSNRATIGTTSITSRGVDPIIGFDHPYSTIAEETRQLRTNLEFVRVDHPPRVIVLSSPMSGDGKTTTAINLATTFAEAGRRTLLLDADLRRGKLAEYLSVDDSVGLSDLLASRVSLSDAVIEVRDNLSVLPHGTPPPNPAEMLESDQMTTLMREMSTRYDMVIIDSPPVLPVTDAIVVAKKSDGLVMVARYGSTTRAQVEESVRSLDAVRVHCLGWVLNGVPRSRRDRTYYSYSSDQAEIAPKSTKQTMQPDASGSTEG